MFNKKIKFNKTTLHLLLLILFIASFLRFINYQNRWILSQDQARDAIIALHSIESKQIPLMGPPSSAGPFSFGPIYYWIIIIFTIIFPFIIGPWVGFTLLSVMIALLFFFVGLKLGGRVFAFIAGLIASVSSAQVAHAPDMLNPVLVGFATTLSLLSLIQLIEYKNFKYSILLGLTVGLAINFHFQAMGLLSLLGLSVLINKFTLSERLKIILGSLGGLLTTFIPFMYFDIRHQGAWIKSVIYYLTVGQDKFYIPIRWLTEIRDFWPHLWGEVLFQIPTTGYIVLIIIFITCMYALVTRRYLSKSWWIICLALLMQVVALRFYKGPRLPVYLIVFHPFVIFFTAWSLWVILSVNKRIGITLLMISVVLATYSNLHIISTPSSAPQILSIKQELDSTNIRDLEVFVYPSSNTLALPIYYLLKREGRISLEGYKIGVSEFNLSLIPLSQQPNQRCIQSLKPLIINKSSVIYDLEIIPNDCIKLMGFKRVTSDQVYSWIYDNYRK